MTTTGKEAAASKGPNVGRRSTVAALIGALTAAAIAPPMAGSGAPGTGKARKKARKVCNARLQAQADELGAVCDARLQAQEEASRAACDVEIKDALEKQLSKVRLTETRICRDVVQDICDNETNPEACVEKVGRCCDPFSDGDVGDAVSCLLVALLP